MKELRAQTGLRGLASLTVVISHFSVLVTIPDELRFVGGPAVDLFFILSGFILCYVYHEEGTHQPRGGWWGYHVARFARIYPIYFVVTAAVVWHILNALRFKPPSEWPWWDVAAQFLLIFHWPFVFLEGWNSPAWSVSVEYFCYLFLFPLTFWMRPVLRHAWVAVPVIIALQYALLNNPYIPPTPNVAGWSGLYRGLLGFLIGVSVFHLFHYAPRVTKVAAWLATPALIALILVSAWPGLSYHFRVSSMYACFVLLALGLTQTTSWAGRLMAANPLHFFGDISYGLYLIHMPVFLMWGRPYILQGMEGYPYLARLAATTGLALIVVLLSWLSYKFFEMPVRILIRRWLGVRTARHAGESKLPTINSPTP